MKNKHTKQTSNSEIAPGCVIFIGWISLHVMYVAFLFMDAVFNLTGDLIKSSHSQTSGSIVAFWGFGIGVIVSGLAGLPLGQSVMENSVKQSQHWFRLFLRMFAAGVIIQIGSCGYSILD